MNENKTGFTLIEIMVAIAIVGILAAIILVSMQSFGKKARASRALAQASSVIPAMVSCAGNYGNDKVQFSGDICSESSSYGSWPTWPSSDYGVDGSNWTSSSNWYFKVKVESDMNAICCNSTMNSCGQPSSCSASATW
jgi:prepilin-type N-terminal cleavage/methylation domain-containing protein